MSKAGELKRWTMQTERFRNGMTSQERSRMVEYTNGMYVLHSDYKALQERVRELEGGMREIMVSVGRVEPKDGHPEFGYIYSVAKTLLKGE